MSNFKVGDEIIMLEDCNNSFKGKKYKLHIPKGLVTLHTKTGQLTGGCNCENKWQLVKKGGSMKIEVGNWYRVVGEETVQDGVYQCCKIINDAVYFWVGGRNLFISNKFIFPCTELEHAYPGAEISGCGSDFIVIDVYNSGISVVEKNSMDKRVWFYNFKELLDFKLVPQTPPVDTKAEECIKYLEVSGYKVERVI